MEDFEKMTADQRHHYLRTILKEDHVITFTKVDGTERVMPCTLRTDAMPQREITEHHQTRAYNPEVISVWCLDKGEWRSFKVMNVKNIEKMST